MLLCLCYHPMGNLHTPEIVAAARHQASPWHSINRIKWMKKKKQTNEWQKGQKMQCEQLYRSLIIIASRMEKSSSADNNENEANNNKRKKRTHRSAYLPVSRRQFSFRSFCIALCVVSLCLAVCVYVSLCPFCLLCSLIWSDKYCWNRNTQSESERVYTSHTNSNNTKCIQPVHKTAQRSYTAKLHSKKRHILCSNMYLSSVSSLCCCFFVISLSL